MDVEGSIGVELQNCKVKDTLSIGIYLRLNDISCKVIGCDVRNTGGTGIYVYKAKDTLVQDCSVAHVTDKSMGFTCTGDHCGIGLQESERTRVLHNLISDVPLQSGVDYYFDVGSQVMYNSLLGVNKGIYPHGAGCVVHGNLVHLTPGGTGSNAVNSGAANPNGSTGIRVSDNVYFDAGIGIMADATKGPVTVFGNTAYAKSSTVKLLISTGPVSSWDNCLVVEEVPA
jgi:nitrous oxidase accessory protein NosD